MRLLAAGRRALLVETATPELRRRLHQALTTTPPDGLVELVPAARTVLVSCAEESDLAAAAAHVRALVDAGLQQVAHESVEPTVIEVRYDGEDLEQVAELVGITPEEVIARHTGQLWTVDFAGFMPGFGYLTGEQGGLTVPRLSSPRTRIPPGSVALADDFTGIYPQASPGGWQLIGTTEAELWRTDRTPPALLVPGAVIQFVEVR
ncbi:allophanate hydrolase subunit 1 [Luteococcus sp.]|uniref:5-oxoprolinase subunit B family protein n=1 Tax=Luteococcus sp. TaxID=1969402 RepID=UPI003735A9CF